MDIKPHSQKPETPQVPEEAVQEVGTFLASVLKELTLCTPSVCLIRGTKSVPQGMPFHLVPLHTPQQAEERLWRLPPVLPFWLLNFLMF